MIGRMWRSNWPPVVLLVLMGALVWLSPAEATLGSGIKYVYVHVAFTWTGMVGFLAAAILAVVAVFAPSSRLASWLPGVYLASLISFSLGLGLSALASYVNWGGVPLREPRMLTSLNVVVVGWVIFFLTRMDWSPKLTALIQAIPIFLFVFSVRSSSLVLHPDNPVQSAPAGIRSTFLGMFALVAVLWVWASARIHSSKANPIQ